MRFGQIADGTRIKDTVFEKRVFGKITNGTKIKHIPKIKHKITQRETKHNDTENVGEHLSLVAILIYYSGEPQALIKPHHAAGVLL